jgi:hypothetical protein
MPHEFVRPVIVSPEGPPGAVRDLEPGLSTLRGA